MQVVGVWGTRCCVCELQATQRCPAKQRPGTERVNCHWMTTECPQKTLSICTCPDSLAMTLARRNETIVGWLHMQTNTEGGPSQGILQTGVARLAALGVCAQRRLARSEIDRLFGRKTSERCARGGFHCHISKRCQVRCWQCKVFK